MPVGEREREDDSALEARHTHKCSRTHTRFTTVSVFLVRSQIVIYISATKQCFQVKPAGIHSKKHCWVIFNQALGQKGRIKPNKCSYLIFWVKKTQHRLIYKPVRWVRPFLPQHFFLVFPLLDTQFYGSFSKPSWKTNNLNWYPSGLIYTGLPDWPWGGLAQCSSHRGP